MTTSIDDMIPAGESSARQIVRALARRGIPRDAISSGDLQVFYSEMSQSRAPGNSGNAPAIRSASATKPSNEPVHAVIVETRSHPCLEFVVQQFARKTGTSLQIYHGTGNKGFIENSGIRNLIDSGQVCLTELQVNELLPQDYNALLLNRDFWASVTGRGQILVFQTDSLLCDNSIYCLEDFNAFDYIGSNWNRKRPVGMIIDGGSGGLSLRDWHMTVECLERFPPTSWPGGEDGYYAFHFDLMGARVAQNEDCGKFSTQSEFTDQSFGAHQFENLRAPVLERFLEYCPEARYLMAGCTGLVR